MYKRKIKLHLDKLEITYQGCRQVLNRLAEIDERAVINGITIVREQKPRWYQYEFRLIGKDYSEAKGEYDRSIGTLYFGSFNVNRQDVYLVYDNAALYDDYLLACRFYVEEALGLEYKRISKIDVALDTNINIVRRYNCISRDETYNLVILDRAYKDMNIDVDEVLHFASGTRRRPMKNRSFSIGNKDNTLLVRCYNKSLEMEKSEKDYIPNISGEMPMYRIEVKIGNHKNITKTLRILGVSIAEELYSNLQNEEFLFSLFLATLDRLIRLRKGRKVYNLIDVLMS